MCKGYTLIETVIVLAVIIAVSSIVCVRLSYQSDKEYLREEGRKLYRQIREDRLDSIDQGIPITTWAHHERYTCYPNGRTTNNTFLIFKGKFYLKVTLRGLDGKVSVCPPFLKKGSEYERW